jgi:transposase InsO family protein
MTYPLVGDLTGEGVPVARSCQVLGFSTQAYYAWKAQPCSERDWDDAHLINAMIDIHNDDPAFGYRFIYDELVAAGWHISENRVHRLAKENRVWSVFAKKRGLNRRSGPPVHDDHLDREFTADARDERWVGDITEHPTAEG